MDRPRRHQTGSLTLNADPADQLRLLDLQELDTRLDRLAHRRETLPAIGALAGAAEEHQRLHDLEVRVGLEADELERRQAQQDADVAQVVARKKRDQARLDAGQVGSPRELQSLQSEIEALERRQRVLEDAELEVMEQLEATQARRRELQAQMADAGERGLAARAERDREWADLDADADHVRAQRDQLAAGIAGPLVQAYDQLRNRLGGVGAAALRQGRCEGCRLQVDAADLRRFVAAPADEVLYCEECRRILVRTPESGL